MDMTSLLVQLISGGVGGNLIGALLKQVNLGPVGNTIVGVIGGLLGGQLGGMMGGAGMADASAASGLDLTTILGSGGGGAALTAVVGLVKQAMHK
jgi:hypothetical protein